MNEHTARSITVDAPDANGSWVIPSIFSRAGDPIVGRLLSANLNNHYLNMLFYLRGFNDMHHVNIEEAKTNLPDLIDAAVNGEEVVIAKDDQHLVKLVPVSREKPHPQFGSARGLITMSEDFDEPLEDFKEYMK